ncbi:homeobox Hox-B3-like protein [Parasponia andersonii]|uniref:Homeobox Hox-B3-like protein n=1 Tax=Parasponia andersonii TaxID=3476 RepID=A0A2P5B1U9_PARAD|nr:homeobox Hox-B3-like protein [Parasponia andersonii]
MAEPKVSLQQTHHHHPNPALQSLFHSLDPISLILSQNSSNSEQPVPLKLTTESFIMERGPRYSAYAELRESKLRMRNNAMHQEFEDPEPKLTPQKKQVKLQTGLTGGRKGSSVLAQSVPDFSAVLRKENRKPPAAAANLPPMMEMTPPGKNWSKVSSKVLTNSRGSKSANGGDKRVLMARKSYASLEDLKGLSSAAANAINGEKRGTRGGGRQTVLGYRAF